LLFFFRRTSGKAEPELQRERRMQTASQLRSWTPSVLLDLVPRFALLLSLSRFFFLCEEIPALGPTGKSRSTDKKRTETAKEGSNEGAKYDLLIDWPTSTPATNFGLR
jgi:hypothetical protein